MNIRGFFINLDKSTDRRKTIEDNIRGVGMDGVITRFAARAGDGRPSVITKNELGCFLSHKEIIDTADNNEVVMIFEDDAHFTKKFKKSIGAIFKDMAFGWDVIFFGQMVDYSDVKMVHKFLNFKKLAGDISSEEFSKFAILNAAKFYTWGAFGYAVHPRALPKLRGYLAQSEQDGFKHQVDVYYADLIREGKLNGGIVFPYIVGVNPDFESTIDDRQGGADVPLHNAMVNLFVVGGDGEKLKTDAIRRLMAKPLDADAFIASHVIYERYSRKKARKPPS